MALFFKNSIAITNSIFQNDKTLDKKFFSNTTFRATTGTDAASSTPTARIIKSFPLNSEEVEIKNILINKNIHMAAFSGAATLYNVDNIGDLTPLINFIIAIGIGDQETNSNIASLNDFNSQNAIIIPCVLNSSISKFEFQPIKEKFFLSKNRTFLNIYIEATTPDTGDITAFKTCFDTVYPVLTMGDFYSDVSVFISGRTKLLDVKKSLKK